jgi:hypothetical protein
MQGNFRRVLYPLITCLVFLTAGVAYAQEDLGAITGVVQDLGRGGPRRRRDADQQSTPAWCDDEGQTRAAPILFCSSLSQTDAGEL